MKQFFEGRAICEDYNTTEVTVSDKLAKVTRSTELDDELDERLEVRLFGGTLRDVNRIGEVAQVL